MDEEDLAPLCTALDVEGFFIDQQSRDQQWRTFIFRGASPEGILRRICQRHDTPKELGNIEVWVLDHESERIGSYFAGGAIAERCDPYSGDAELVDITVTGLLHIPPHPGAGSVWERWRSGRPTHRDLWVEYSLEGREAWLEVARLHQFTAKEYQAKVESRASFEVHGEHITDKTSLYCALGEAVNGPGGYLGASLDGLADCLRGGFGATPPFGLTWRSSSATRNHLGEYFSQVIDSLECARVVITLSD